MLERLGICLLMLLLIMIFSRIEKDLRLNSDSSVVFSIFNLGMNKYMSEQSAKIANDWAVAGIKFVFYLIIVWVLSNYTDTVFGSMPASVWTTAISGVIIGIAFLLDEVMPVPLIRKLSCFSDIEDDQIFRMRKWISLLVVALCVLVTIFVVPVFRPYSP